MNQKALLILEPEARSTAPAIALAAFAALQRDPDAILFVLPSDGMIQGEKTFQKAVANAVELAKKTFLLLLVLDRGAQKQVLDISRQGIL